MEYVISVVKVNNPRFPLSIGIVEKNFYYERVNGRIPQDTTTITVPEYPEDLLVDLGSLIGNALTVFDEGRAYIVPYGKLEIFTELLKKYNLQ